MLLVIKRFREHRGHLPEVNDGFCQRAVSDVDPTGSVGRFPGPTVKP
jgi:hypothetical protein